MATHKCRSCDATGYDHDLTATIGQKLTPKLKHWPPQYISEHNIRDVLSAIRSLGDIVNFEQDPTKLCAKHDTVLTYRPAEDTEKVADYLSAATHGLCYKCTKIGATRFHCEHKSEPQSLMGCVSEPDPLV